MQKVIIKIPLSIEPVIILTNSGVLIKYISEMFFPYVKVKDVNMYKIQEDWLIVKEYGETCSVEIYNVIYDNVKIEKLPKIAYFYFSNVLSLQDFGYYAHGASLSYESKGFILLGNSGMGKSTLSAFLHLDNNPFLCMSDDKVLINSTTLEMFPIGDKIHLREQSLNVLHEKEIKPMFEISKFFSYERYTIRYEHQKKFILKGVIQIERNLEGINEIQHIGSEEAFKILLNNCLALKNIKKNIKAIISLADKVKIFRMKYSDLDEAKEMLLSLNN